MGRPDEAILAELAEVATRIEARNEAQDRDYARRMALYHEARGEDREPKPITFGRIAEAAKVSEVAVIQALRKDKAKTDHAAAATSCGP
jgi:hypothetical protein